jgi:hypothetical protein
MSKWDGRLLVLNRRLPDDSESEAGLHFRIIDAIDAIGIYALHFVAINNAGFFSPVRIPGFLPAYGLKS